MSRGLVHCWYSTTMRRTIRFMTKWTCTLVLPPLVIVWLLSFLLCPMWSPKGARVWIGKGEAGYQGGGAVSPPDFHLWRARSIPFGGPAVWMPRVESNWMGELVIVPLWIPTTLLVAVSLPLWHADLRTRHRKRLGLCLRCGYNRRGLAENAAACPECGTVPRT
jgi:hypothetical protein